MTILFVCTGNTCRSPLAVAAWRALQSRGEIPADWNAESAGISPHVGASVARHSADIARGWDVDLSQHRARAADAKSLRQVDACVGITRDHARALQQIARSLKLSPRVLCLEDFLTRSGEQESVARLLGSAGGKSEIADPYGGSREAYESCAALIACAVEDLARRLGEGSGGEA